MNTFIPPEYRKKDFHCPHCNVYANQRWVTLGYSSHIGGIAVYDDLVLSSCHHCKQDIIWYREQMLYPDKSIAPLHHEDLPPELIEDYLEAASIVNKSPRGASALLRLLLQKLMVLLGEPGKDINKDIGSLVSKGLPQQVQQALDIVRVIGNESVHPGQLDLKDDVEIALQLFILINFIVEDRISRPKNIQALFDKLPPGKKAGIESRDKIKTP